MAQIRKLTGDGARTNSRGEDPVSARQEILTSLVSALDSVCIAISKLNAEVVCVTVHEDSVIAMGTEKGRGFLNSRKEIQTDFYKFCRAPFLQNLTTTNAHTKNQEGDNSQVSKDGEQGKARASSDTQPNDCVLRKLVGEIFSVLYSEALGKSSLVPVPYEWIQKDPSCFVAHGLPEGVVFKKPSEYNTKTLMKILEQSHRIHFMVKRPAEDLTREPKSNPDVNPSTVSTPIMPLSNVRPGKSQFPAPCSSPATSSNSVLSSFLYGMPMSSKPHPDGKLDFQSMPVLNLGKERQPNWSEKGKDNATTDDPVRFVGEQSQVPSGAHISKRLLFSIVHEKSEKWDSFIQETEDINTLRECVQILFNSRYAEALGLDHMVPVPYRKIACDPGAVEIIGIPDQIPFKRPCTYGVPKLKRILDERHGIRFIVKRMFDERIFTAAGKIAKEEGKHDLSCLPEDNLSDNLHILPTAAELLSNAQTSRSTSACVSPVAEYEAGPSGESIVQKKIKMEPPDEDILQITVPEATSKVEDGGEPVAESAVKAACPSTALPSVLSDLPSSTAPNHKMEALPDEGFPPSPGSRKIRAPAEAGSLVETIGEMISKLRREVESLFSTKYAEALGLPEPTKVPYYKFQMYPKDLYVTGLPEGISLRHPISFGSAKLRRILAASSQIQFVINRPELLTDPVQQAMSSLSFSDSELVISETPPLDDTGAISKRSSFSECMESKLSRIDLANTLREQVQDLFNKKYGEALGIKYPVQVPYKRIKNNPDSVIIEGLPPGIPFRKPCTFGSQNLERILAVADKINFTITRPFQGLIPKPAPRRATLLKKTMSEDDINRMGEKVVLREQVKQLFNKKYGEALGLDRSVVVPYKLIRGSPESVEVNGLPGETPFRNPNTYDIASLEKILQTADKITFTVKNQLQPFADICSQAVNTGTEASVNRRKRKRVQESPHVSTSPTLALSTSQIPVMQWPMYMVDYSGVNVQLPGKVNY